MISFTTPPHVIRSYTPRILPTPLFVCHLDLFDAQLPAPASSRLLPASFRSLVRAPGTARCQSILSLLKRYTIPSHSHPAITLPYHTQIRIPPSSFNTTAIKPIFSPYFCNITSEALLLVFSPNTRLLYPDCGMQAVSGPVESHRSTGFYTSHIRPHP